MTCMYESDSISTHAPAGGATRRSIGISPAREISTHAPAGGATLQFYAKQAQLAISTHAPAGGATNCPITSNPCIIFLLTPLREGRQVRPLADYVSVKISTHAPAGGATAAVFLFQPGQHISTHAPAGGATEDEIAGLRCGFIISTHAPAGGATSWPDPEQSASTYFYSRPCGRGDKYGAVLSV